MKALVLGNAGSGKSTLTSQLASCRGAAVLALDDIAFADGSERHPPEVSIAAALGFARTHTRWIIEGCYADMLEALAPQADTLIFLNPGIDACIAQSRLRPWEPAKFSSPAAQQAQLEALCDWIATYATRDDEYGLQRHRALHDGFAGTRLELADPARYLEQALAAL